MEISQEKLKVYNNLLNFKGYGDPNSTTWFIGFEENWNKIDPKYYTGLSDIEILNNFKEYKDEYYNNETENNIYVPTYEGINDINNLINENKKYFLSNFRPIGYTGTKLCDFLSIFNKSYANYELELRNLRLIEISKIWKKNKPQITIVIIGSRVNDIYGDAEFLFNQIIPGFNIQKAYKGLPFNEEFESQKIFF